MFGYEFELGTLQYANHTRQVGGCQTDADGLELLGEECAVVQPCYPLCRIGL
jgi:hypothetical protein